MGRIKITERYVDNVIDSHLSIKHVPRIDRVRLARKIEQSRNPRMVRVGDTFHLRAGPFKVCRVILGAEGFENRYVCTNGVRTEFLRGMTVDSEMHFRQGIPIRDWIRRN